MRIEHTQEGSASKVPHHLRLCSGIIVLADADMKYCAKMQAELDMMNAISAGDESPPVSAGSRQETGAIEGHKDGGALMQGHSRPQWDPAGKRRQRQR